MITIYGKEGCKNCELAKQFFNDENVEYTYYDLKVKENRDARKTFREKGWSTLPVVLFGEGMTVSGYNEQLFKELLCVIMTQKN